MWLTYYRSDPSENFQPVSQAHRQLESALGGLLWGWISDHFGRRIAGSGFVIAAAIIPIYLFVPMSVTLLALTGFTYGVMLSCSAIWGPWLSELYPPHLRSTAASIFNWGRVISMTAPLITAPLAEQFGLAPVMSLASVSFLAAAAIWFSLPETVARRTAIGRAVSKPMACSPFFSSPTELAVLARVIIGRPRGENSFWGMMPNWPVGMCNSRACLVPDL